MSDMEIQQHSDDEYSLLNRICISYTAPIKTKMQDSFEFLQDKKFTTNYPFTKIEDRKVPEPTNFSFKNQLILFVLITVVFPLLLLFMPLGVLLNYKDHLKSKHGLKKEFIEYKARYLRGERYSSHF